MKCITLSSGKQVCFDSTPKAQPGLKATSSRFNFPLSKEEQLMQQARMLKLSSKQKSNKG